MIYDIGAYTGKWSDMVRKKLLSIAPKNEIRFILFEPNQCHTESINGLGFRNHETLLSDRKKKVKFYSVQGTGDSYFRENHLLYQEHTAKTFQTATLDNLRMKDAYEYPQPDFIKIDTQGSELEILQGSRKTLRNCKFILIELSLVSYNIGAPRIQEVVDYCLNIQFFPFRHIENHYANGVLVQIDILFINRSLLESKFNVEAKDEWMSTS